MCNCRNEIPYTRETLVAIVKKKLKTIYFSKVPKLATLSAYLKVGFLFVFGLFMVVIWLYFGSIFVKKKLYFNHKPTLFKVVFGCILVNFLL